MSILSNTKAQMNKMYTGLKNSPVAKGLKGMLHEEGLVTRSQKKILDNINENSQKEIKAISEISKMLDSNSTGANKMSDIIDSNINTIDGIGVNGIGEGDFKRFLDGRFKNDKSMRDYQGEVILNKAKAQVVGNQSTRIDQDKARTFISSAAKDVDGQVAFMTPITMAQEYYGNPLMSSISNFKTGNKEEAIKDASKFGLRVGATVGAVAGTSMAVKGTYNLTATAFDRAKSNIANSREERNQ